MAMLTATTANRFATTEKSLTDGRTTDDYKDERWLRRDGRHGNAEKFLIKKERMVLCSQRFMLIVSLICNRLQRFFNEKMFNV